MFKKGEKVISVLHCAGNKTASGPYTVLRVSQKTDALAISGIESLVFDLNGMEKNPAIPGARMELIAWEG